MQLNVSLEGFKKAVRAYYSNDSAGVRASVRLVKKENGSHFVKGTINGGKVVFESELGNETITNIMAHLLEKDSSDFVIERPSSIRKLKAGIEGQIRLPESGCDFSDRLKVICPF